MRDLLNLFDKIAESNNTAFRPVTEATLEPSQIIKYPERFDAFIDHIQSRRPFYVDGTDEEVVLDPKEADRFVELRAAGNFKGRVLGTDINGNQWPLSKFKKTAEFGGASTKPGEAGDLSKVTKESAALKPSTIGITDKNIPASKLGSVITSNKVLKSTEYGLAVIKMAEDILAGNPATIPEEYRKNAAIKKAIVDYAGEYLGVLALVQDQSHWYGGSAKKQDFLDWLGGDLNSLVINFPSATNNQLADSFAIISNASTGHTLNISSKGTGGGAAPSLSGIKVPDHLRKKKQYKTAIEIIDLCSSTSLPSPRSVSQVFYMMNLLHEQMPETIPSKYRKHLPWSDELIDQVKDSLKNRTPMPKYEPLFKDLDSKGADGGKLTYVVKKAVMEIINGGAVPEFESVVLEVLDYNFIQQYASANSKSGEMTFATQWPARLDGNVTLETKSGGTDPSKGGFSFKLHPTGSAVRVDPGPVPGEEPVASEPDSTAKTSTADLDVVTQKKSSVKAAPKKKVGTTADLGRKRR